MKNLKKILIITLLNFILAACNSTGPQTNKNASSLTKQSKTIKAMSFNIRYNNKHDGKDAWPVRKPIAFKVVNTHQPDIIGMQEVLHSQAQDIRANLPQYTFHGVGRDDGKTRGEYSPILFRTSRFTILQKGHLWLSEKPDTPGVVSWDSSMTRMASWVLLSDKYAPKQTPLLIINAHYDHRGRQARIESSKVIAKKMQPISKNAQVIILGDFNVPPFTPPYKTLISQLNLKDAHGHMNTDNDRTFHGFKGIPTGARIDWVLHSPSLIASDSKIIRSHQNGRYPSDHFPVITSLQYTYDK